MTGYGDGIVARRGFNRPSPASYHQDRLRQAPVGHFFDVMTNGWGAMPSYASQVPVEDRWRITAYVRALQLSQMKPSTCGTRAQGRVRCQVRTVTRCGQGSHAQNDSGLHTSGRTRSRAQHRARRRRCVYAPDDRRRALRSPTFLSRLIWLDSFFGSASRVGSLALLMLQHLTGGAWGLVIRRVLEASTRTLPLMILLFVPIVIGLNHIYPWTDPAVMNEHRGVTEKGGDVFESVVLHHSRGDLFRHLVGSGHAFELAFASAGSRPQDEK